MSSCLFGIYDFEVEKGELIYPDFINLLDKYLNKKKHRGVRMKGTKKAKARRNCVSKNERDVKKHLKNNINLYAKTIVCQGKIIVMEDLTGISKDTKKRRKVNRELRRKLNSRQYGYVFDTIQRLCEERGASFEKVGAENTSRACSDCGHIERANRRGSSFKCRSCGYSDHADINSAKNIGMKFIQSSISKGAKNS